MHGHKPTADAWVPPSRQMFSPLFPAKSESVNAVGPVICRFKLADCGDMQGFDGRKYSHSHQLYYFV